MAGESVVARQQTRLRGLIQWREGRRASRRSRDNYARRVAIGCSRRGIKIGKRARTSEIRFEKSRDFLAPLQCALHACSKRARGHISAPPKMTADSAIRGTRADATRDKFNKGGAKVAKMARPLRGRE